MTQASDLDLRRGRARASRSAETRPDVRRRAYQSVRATGARLASRLSPRRLASTGAVERAAALVERFDSSRPSVLRVLTYHRVDRPDPFASHVEHLAARYRVVSAGQVVDALEGGPALPRRSVLLTFDDGYRSFAEVAWPILRSRGLPATLFVPTAYPDSSRAAFWWDRLGSAFRSTELRRPLETPVGALPMHTPRERARAHARVKAHVKELPHEETLRTTDAVCAALGAPVAAHEVLGWEELRELAAEGVTLGAHSRTHPRLDRVSWSRARDEALGSLADLEREFPHAPRIFAYPDGRHGDEIVEVLRSAAVELAFTTRRGTNDLSRCDPLRLRRLNVDAADPLPVLRAKLALTAARLEPARRLLAPPSAAERRVERRQRARFLLSKYVLRALDAVLTGGLQPSPANLLAQPDGGRDGSRYERVRSMTRFAVRVAPALERGLTRALVSTERLPLRGVRIELGGFGSGTTVFRLERGAGSRPLALKVHRRTLGRDSHGLATAARRCTRQIARLRATFGDAVLPGRILVLHSPLRGTRAVACVQPWLRGPLHDLLALDDRGLRSLLGRHPALAGAFETFARQALAWRAKGSFPDLLGAQNLVAVEEPEGLRLRLIDYGIFDGLRRADPCRQSAALDTVAARLRALLDEGRSR